MTGKKFALIDYFERQEVEIIETRHFITKFDSSFFNGEKWDPVTQIHVMWPVKKIHGVLQEKHVAKVLRFGDEMSKLMPYLKAAEKGTINVSPSGELEYGRGKRIPERKRSWSSEDEETDDDVIELDDRQQSKLRKKTKKKMEDDIRSELQESNDQDSLKKENQELREENAALRTSLRIIKGLPELLDRMRSTAPHWYPPTKVNKPVLVQTQAKENTPLTQARENMPLTQARENMPLTQARENMPLTQARENTPVVMPQITQASVNTSVTNSSCPPKIKLQRVFNYDVNAEGKVDLGFGVQVNGQNLQYVSRSDIKKMTYTICETVFTREELSKSSITGKASNAFKDQPLKPMLDSNKLLAVIEFVKRQYTNAEEKTIKKIIAAKLNICQKLEKNRCK